jgi:catechol 2,3-dioxygenase-like lactoylglutathione lyase family enzyme
MDAVLCGDVGDQTDQESRSAGHRAAASVTAMDCTVHPGFLPHEDPEASLAFWRDTLGFEVRDDVGYGGLRWITVGPAGQPGTSIVLEPPFAPGCGVTDQERRTIVEMMAKGTYAGVNLATADLDGVFERLQASGAPGGPGNPPYPSRARRRSVTATRSRTTPEAGRTILRQPVRRTRVRRSSRLGGRRTAARSTKPTRRRKQCRSGDDNTHQRHNPNGPREDGWV